MKVLAFVIVAAAGSIAGYCLGYRQGGEDLVYLDHVTQGRIAIVTVSECEKRPDPVKCYRYFTHYATHHAVIFHTDYRDSVSPAAPFIFPDIYATAMESLVPLRSFAKSEADDQLCAALRSLGEGAPAACRAEFQAFQVATEGLPGPDGVLAPDAEGGL